MHKQSSAINQCEFLDMDEVASKARQANKPGICPEDQISEAGRRIMGFHFGQMISRETGARLGEDIEAVHDMRVAARRMRVALELFKPFFKKKTVKPYSVGLRSTSRALGRVRDLDVFLGKLNVYVERLPEDERLGFEIFLTKSTEKHHKARSKMVLFLESEPYEIFTRQFGRFLESPGEGVKRSKTIQPNLVRDLAPIMIYERLAAVRAYEQALGSATIKELHALRLEFKKLRYTVEFFREVLSPKSKEVIRDIKRLQDHLGKLNDADVACQITNGLITRLEEEQAILPVHQRLNMEPTYTYLTAKSDERDRLIASFPETWQAVMGNALYEKIAKAISSL
jgi:CHAD domain-containing protein